MALDAQRIQNVYDSANGVFDEAQTIQKHLEYFHKAPANNEHVHDQEGFALSGLNTQGQPWQIIVAAERRFLGWNRDAFHECTSRIQIPDWASWCPDTLLDIEQLASYYDQLALEYAYQHMNDDGPLRMAFPNALYLDAIDVPGTLRTGTTLLDGSDRRGDDDAQAREAKYAYFDTLYAYNTKRACQSFDEDHRCQALVSRHGERLFLFCGRNLLLDATRIGQLSIDSAL